MKIAFIGLGAMGTLMARNLVKAGFAVTGYDTNPRAMAHLEGEGGQVAATAAAAAQDADVLLLMVVNAAQAESVLFEAGALAATAPNATVLLMATCPPGGVQTLAKRVMDAGRRFADSPVSGGTVGADRANLSIMVAGEPEVLDFIRPVLNALGDKVFHVGTEPGQAAVVKAVNQLLCGVHIAVAAEGIALARKVGIDPAVIIEILSGSAASSWMLKDRGPRMMEDEPVVTSAVDIFVKDLGIVLETGRDVKAALPLAALAHQLFVATSGRGDGARDDSQVIRSYALLNGY